MKCQNYINRLIDWFAYSDSAFFSTTPEKETIETATLKMIDVRERNAVFMTEPSVNAIQLYSGFQAQ